MFRLQPLLRTTQRAVLPTRQAALSLRFTSTSSPKSAEKASAQSGGSRSKSAAEDAGANDDSSPPSNATSADASSVPDALSDGEMLGRTGGGEDLEASTNPPPRPTVRNQNVPQGKDKKLTKEQQKEVDEHNKDFEAKHDRANPAEDDKVDDNFWGGRDAGSKD